MRPLNSGHLLQHVRQRDDEALGQLIEGFRPRLRTEVARELDGFPQEPGLGGPCPRVAQQ